MREVIDHRRGKLRRDFPERAFSMLGNTFIANRQNGRPIKGIRRFWQILAPVLSSVPCSMGFAER